MAKVEIGQGWPAVCRHNKVGFFARIFGRAVSSQEDDLRLSQLQQSKLERLQALAKAEDARADAAYYDQVAQKHQIRIGRLQAEEGACLSPMGPILTGGAQ